MSLMCFFLGCRYEREPAPARRPVDPLMTVKMLTALADERASHGDDMGEERILRRAAGELRWLIEKEDRP